MLALVAAVAMAAQGAGAQNVGIGAPIPLTPPRAPAESLVITPPPAWSATGPVTPPGVIGPDLGGLLAPDSRGLGVALWSGSTLAEIEPLLTALPVASPSPAQRHLTLRLLLSAAPPPAGENADRTLLLLRARKLLELGDAGSAAALIAGTPGVGADPALAGLGFQAQLLAGPDRLECSEAMALARRLAEGEWLKLRVFCQLRDGDRAGAGLGIELLREQKPADDAFLTLAEALAAGVPPALAHLPDPGPLHLALARLAQAPLPADVLEKSDPGRLAVIARSPATDPDLRAAAAERAAAAGTLPASELMQAYAGVRFTPAELGRPLSSREKGARLRALLYQAIEREPQAAVRAELIQRALERTEPALVPGAVGAVPALALERLPPSVATAWLIPAAARSFYAQGRAEALAPWLELPQDERTAAALLKLWPLATLADPGAAGFQLGDPPGEGGALAPLPGSALGLNAWLQLMQPQADASRRGRVGAILGLLEAAGESVPAESWPVGARPASQTLPPPALDGLRQAAATGRSGAVVLQALTLLGSGGPQSLAPPVLIPLVAALRSFGFAAEARALAREAVLALLD